MKVLIIIGCVLLYILCGIFVAVLVRNEIDDDSDLFFAAIFWPITAVCGVFWLVFCIIPKAIIEKIEERRR